ncbi:hypothetical protein JAAARDRAFT_79592 [Jaapia argillacea MUCL 33604]|uniref:Protein kinase domain-containing protein n=1 Tax=Jaapia argillacea MUCL 33604 TaxID=933084 RepID=A0A067PN05_9AGAM|nr:hypothetical protein JAAARDRAFT_79592 [Jaapia argillacea MUCL 33604]
MARLIEVTPETSWKFNWKSSKSCGRALEDLLELREKALDNPLKADDTLSCYGPSLFPCTIKCNTTPTSPSYRTPISLLLEPPRNDLNSPLVLRLVQPLQTGTDCFGQVWKCHVIAHPNFRSSADSPPITVVLKLYQQSLAPLPAWEVMCRRVTERYCPIDHVARREDKASELLSNLQGTFLPYSYGIYEFEPPCGEKSWGHITEFIDGLTFGDFVMAHKDNRMVLEQLFTSFMRDIVKLGPQGIEHDDIRQDNILVIPSSSPSSPPSPVLIDFGSSVIWDCTDPEFDSQSLYRNLQEFLWLCDEYDCLKDIVEAWQEQE